jgi:hypothetical protein
VPIDKKVCYRSAAAISAARVRCASRRVERDVARALADGLGMEPPRDCATVSFDLRFGAGYILAASQLF